MRKDIKQLVNYYVRKFNTRNPYDLAKSLNVEVQIGELMSLHTRLCTGKRIVTL